MGLSLCSSFQTSSWEQHTQDELHTQASSLKLDRWSTAFLHQQNPKHSEECNFSIQKEALP